MAIRWVALGGLATALLALGTLAAPPAGAQTWYGDDADNPSTVYGDISRVQADHAPRNVVAKVRYHGGAPGEYLSVYLDTRPGDPGPEFVLRVTILTEYYDLVDHWSLTRVDRFGQTGRTVRCAGDRASRTRRHAIFTVVPRACLAIGDRQPGRIRVSVESRTKPAFDTGKVHFDWTPRQHRFGPWLARA